MPDSIQDSMLGSVSFAATNTAFITAVFIMTLYAS